MYYRNKSKPKDAEVSLDEFKDMPLCEPSPLSTRNLRNKYVRKPLSEYGKKSSSKDKKVRIYIQLSFWTLFSSEFSRIS